MTKINILKIVPFGLKTHFLKKQNFPLVIDIPNPSYKKSGQNGPLNRLKSQALKAPFLLSIPEDPFW